MRDLSVEVRDRDIIVRGLETGHSVTYRRVPEKPLLVALDPIRDDPECRNSKVSRRGMESGLCQGEGTGLALIRDPLAPSDNPLAQSDLVEDRAQS
jgi:hypothetical protein